MTESVVVGGIEYYTVKEFAKKTNRSITAVYNLVVNGNSIRKLKSKRLFKTRVMIEASEVSEFPFTPAGRRAEEKPYHYDEEGTIKEGAV